MAPILVVTITESNHTLVDVDTGFLSPLILSKGKAPFTEACVTTRITLRIAHILEPVSRSLSLHPMCNCSRSTLAAANDAETTLVTRFIPDAMTTMGRCPDGALDIKLGH